MLRRIAVVVLAGVVLLLAFAATRPDEFRVERRIRVAAPPDRVFALLDDFESWRRWSPWETKDPAMQRSASGAASGIGARYAWDGNSDVGKGTMEIVEANPGRSVAIRLDFEKPMRASNRVLFTLTPYAEGTEVVWAMSGSMPFVSKLMSVFVSMDTMVGPDFEAGLSKLKSVAET